MKELKEHDYHAMYWNSTSGRAMGADHQRNRALFIQMAKEWGFTHELPCYLPSYFGRCEIIDHVRKYHTEAHGDVFVFSPYIYEYDGEDEEKAYERMMNSIFKLKPSLIGVYPPKFSFYHDHSFTFVVKGPRRTKRYNPNLIMDD